MHLKLPETLLHQHKTAPQTPGLSLLSQDNVLNIVTRRKSKGRLLGDMYHNCLTMGWLSFFATMTAAYLLLNLLFSVGFYLVPHGLSNVHSGNFWGDFFFSAQTLSTVGYGYIYPQSPAANALATFEMLVGVISTAIITGLVFARFSRPQARVLFSSIVTIFQEGENLKLNFRLGNLRNTPLMNTSVEAILARTRCDENGHTSLQLEILPLVYNHFPVFPVSLSFTHHITESSPLHGLDKATLEEQQARIFLIFNATDPVSAQDVFAHHTYMAQDMLYGARFVSLLRASGQGLMEVDFSLFHTTSPDPLPARDEEPITVTDETSAGTD
ncbi:ATP-sensitive potassium channel protein [Bombella sp. ESL0380]|uniref:ion channel n=1 Tax=Bombella sp. ESL0380 TaxID=2676444 RepID=UPI00139C3673|nr:ATP-sensitive potassium channel protein [Bombella sp. ESL0380]